MAILMPDLTVEVYNADFRVLSREPFEPKQRDRFRCAPAR
jgi:hypothetical protein